MKILLIHNDYAKFSGEENALQEIANVLQEFGHSVNWFKRSSAELEESYFGLFQAFFRGIYNPSIRRDLDELLISYKPDIIQVQNIYPLLSVSIFDSLKKYNKPIVMRCPNYRLFCPNGLCLDINGIVCEKCFGVGKEFWCVIKNCENNIFKSSGYALRNYYARISRKIFNTVDLFIVQSEFQKQKFIAQGISSENIDILPGVLPSINYPITSRIGNNYVSFIGRLSKEKGIYDFIKVAGSLPKIPFKIAGEISNGFKIPKNVPKNIEFVGFLKGSELDEFYSKSKIIVVPSKCYEGFPNVILHGMMLKIPVIATNIGGIPSIIDNNINGILVTPNSLEELSKSIKSLYYQDSECKRIGDNGKLKAEMFTKESVYNQLIKIYNKAKELHNG